MLDALLGLLQVHHGLGIGLDCLHCRYAPTDIIDLPAHQHSQCCYRAHSADRHEESGQQLAIDGAFGRGGGVLVLRHATQHVRVIVK